MTSKSVSSPGIEHKRDQAGIGFSWQGLRKLNSELRCKHSLIEWTFREGFQAKVEIPNAFGLGWDKANQAISDVASASARPCCVVHGVGGFGLRLNRF